MMKIMYKHIKPQKINIVNCCQIMENNTVSSRIYWEAI